MQVLRTAVHPKHPARPAEDVALVTDHLVAVIDGATDKAGNLYRWQAETVTSGRFAALVVADTLTRQAATDPTATPRVLVDAATEALHTAVAAQYPHLPAPHYPACVLVAYQPATATLLRVGDCQWAYQGTTHPGSLPIDEVTAAMRAAVLEAHVAAGATPAELAETDPGRVAIADLLARQNVFANREGPLGYGCLNGHPVPDAYLETTILAPGARLILASDGYPELCGTYAATEARLAHLLTQDPLCIRELRGTKGLTAGANSYDDRTWLELLT